MFSELVSKKNKTLFTQENIQQVQSPYQRIIFSQDLKSAPVTTDGPGLRNGPIGNPISTWDIFLSQEPCPESPFLFLLAATAHFQSTWGSSLPIFFKN